MTKPKVRQCMKCGTYYLRPWRLPCPVCSKEKK